MKELTLQELCPDIDRWSETWEGLPEDVAYGKELLREIKPFIEHLINDGLNKKTIKRHIDNLWLLGGGLIRDINMTESLRQKAPLDLIRDHIDEEGGPYCRHLTTEAEMRSFDATCRKFHKFLLESKSSV
jgi:hypothetical protein